MNFKKLNLILITGVILFSILTVFQQGKYYNYDYKVQEMQRELKNIQNENQDMQVRYNMLYDLKKVSDFARTKLNMVFPKEVKCIYE